LPSIAQQYRTLLHLLGK